MFQVMAWFTCFIRQLLRHSTAFNIQPFNGRNGCTELYHPIRLVLQCKKRFQMLPVQFNHQHVDINVRNVQSAMQQIVSFLFLATSLLNVTSTRNFILPSVHFLCCYNCALLSVCLTIHSFLKIFSHETKFQSLCRLTRAAPDQQDLLAVPCHPAALPLGTVTILWLVSIASLVIVVASKFTSNGVSLA